VITNLPSRNNPKIAAFSLVEVVLAMSIMGFVCVTLLGLMATGLGNVQKSTTTTVNAQIMQTVVNYLEVQSFTNNLPILYFDDEGTDVTSTGTGLYQVTLTGTTAAPGATIQGTFTISNARLLQVHVVSQASPNTTNTFSLVWPNTGY